MKKLVTLFLFFTTLLLSNELTTQESSVFGTKIEQNAEVPKRVSSGKNLYLSYTNYPTHVYKNQRFAIEIKALITRNDFDYIQTKFLNGKNISPSNPNERWVKSSTNKNTFTNNFYFKATESNFIMPTIEIRLYSNKTLLEARTILGQDISFSEIAKSDERFSNVIAKDLTLIGSKTKQYNNQEALTIIDLNATESNLEDFKLRDFSEQGITVIEDNLPNQHIIYNVTIPIHLKNIVFNYYNTTTNSFQKISVPIILEEDLVSTQTDLNPNNSSFEFYKKIAVGILALIFLVLFIWRRKYYFLIPFIIFLIVFIVFAIPNENVKLKAGTVIYILPTKNSTIFQKIDQEMSVEEMKRKDGFTKIMFGSGNYIGWVKDKDVSKN